MTSVAVSVSVALQMGVGSAELPEGNTMSRAMVEPLIVPVNVPALFMWHDEHEPSAASTAFVAAVPVSADPFWVIVSDRVWRPSELDPGPVQTPPSADPLGPEGEDPQAASANPIAAVTRTIEVRVITGANGL